MSSFELLPSAYRHLDEIYAYGEAQWGSIQARKYAASLFATFDQIGNGLARKRRIPSALPGNGYFVRCRHHFIYWREPEGTKPQIVAVLHERMHHGARLAPLFADEAF